MKMDEKDVNDYKMTNNSNFDDAGLFFDNCDDELLLQAMENLEEYIGQSVEVAVVQENELMKPSDMNENISISSDDEPLSTIKVKLQQNKTVKKRAEPKNYNLGLTLNNTDTSSDEYDSDRDPDYNVGECEVYVCGGEVFAACHRCDMLMCYEHFNNNETCENHGKKQGKTKKRKKQKEVICNKAKKQPTKKSTVKKVPIKKLPTRYNIKNTKIADEIRETPEDFIVEGEPREVPIIKVNRINKQKAAKLKRTAGEEYTSVKTNKVVPARAIGVTCNSLKCSKFGRDCGKITDESRTEIFRDYYALGDLRLQREYIVRHIENVDKKRNTTNENSRRKKTNNYFLTVQGRRISVCKQMFLNTLGISERTSRTAIQKVLSTGVVEQERRGGRQSEDIKARDDMIRESISNHIDRFARVESHYCRASSTKEYLHSDLNLPKIYKMYAQEYSGPLPTPSFSTYSRVFKEKNVDFHKPKKDMCSLCMTYREGNDETKAKLALKYENHIAEKEEFRKIKNELKTKSLGDQNVKIASFDMQQVIHLPISQESALFYKRRLATYNLTLYDIGTRGCHCFTWHEGQSKRGSNEVATAIYKGLQTYDEDGVKEVNLFADGCSGQNKNSILPAMMLYTVENSKNIEKISLRFSESFHGQSEGDSVHSTIGNAVKRAGSVFVPSQLIPIFRLARNPPYTVHELQFDDFLDFKSLSLDLRILKNRETDQGEEIKWTEFMEICVERNRSPKTTPYKIMFKISHREQDHHTIELKGRNIKIKGYKLKTVNREPLKIDNDKYNDLLSLCSGELPIIRLEDHKRFYVNLPH